MMHWLLKPSLGVLVLLFSLGCSDLADAEWFAAGKTGTGWFSGRSWSGSGER